MSSCCKIIAEAGVNHNGSIDMALRLIEEAARAGANFVKFQTFNPEELACRSTPKADYQKLTSDAAESQLDMLQRLVLPLNSYHKILKFCIDYKIQFLSSPFDLSSIDFLYNLGLRIFKIPSGEITNLPYLRKLGSLRCDIILSTGMSTLEEIGAALHILQNAGTPIEQITLLHCTTQYPTPYEQVHLNAMGSIRNAFPQIAGVGYSDHTQGIAVPIAAVALGATVIEKHFTLDKDLPGPDHKASLNPDELRQMVMGIRHVEKALGQFEKKPQEDEVANMAIVRKSLVAARQIRKGDLFSSENVTVKRPGTGISPMKWDEIMGQRARRDYAEDELL